MGKFLSICICFQICILSTIHAKIFEVTHIKEVERFITQDSLVIFDIDDTLMVPKHMLGSDTWFQNQFSQNLLIYPSVQEALENTLSLWESIRHVSDMELVEKNTSFFIRNLQKKRYTIMGLTTQGIALATRTIQQLENFGIDLNHTSPFKKDYYIFNADHGVLYRKGILFTSGQKKGFSFMRFCKGIDYCPSRIIFLNDKLSHIKDLQFEVEKYNIEFVGLRYTYSDSRKKNFDPEIAKVQLKHSSFLRILPDDEAKEMLQKN